MERMSFSDVRAIVFDKDGTLIDFDAFWVAVSERALDILFRGLDVCDCGAIKDEIMRGFGVTDGVTDPDAVLCRGTFCDSLVSFLLSRNIKGWCIARYGA